MTWFLNRLLCFFSDHHWSDLPDQRTGDVVHWHKKCGRCDKYRSGHYISPSDI